jgi:5-methylcytosine-specific restriction endonuclease McrA
MGMLPPRFCGRCAQTALPGSQPPRCAQHRTTPKSPGASSRDRRYQLAVWRVHTRRAVLGRDPLCSFLTQGVRCLRLATQIHHIVPADEWTAQGHDFFDLENLCGLCAEHHDQIRHMPFSLDVLALPWRG